MVVLTSGQVISEDLAFKRKKVTFQHAVPRQEDPHQEESLLTIIPYKESLNGHSIEHRLGREH
jgi:hypothetical protein